MPIVLILALAVLALFVLFLIGVVRIVRSQQKHRGFWVAAFLLATLVMILSFVEFGSISAFVSETNTPVVDIAGGPVRNILQFLNLALVTILWAMLGLRLLAKAHPTTPEIPSSTSYEIN